jgi:hypothetical protein
MPFGVGQPLSTGTRDISIPLPGRRLSLVGKVGRMRLGNFCHKRWSRVGGHLDPYLAKTNRLP